MSDKKFEFTEEQRKYIIENWGKESAHSMKKKFGCTWYAVVDVAKASGLALPTTNHWTKEEIDRLSLLSETYDYEEIAKMMGKTPNAIYLKSIKLGIVLIMDKRKWTQEEEEQLFEKWGRESLENIAKELKRSVLSVKVKASRMKLGPMIQANIDQISVADISRILNVRGSRITDTWINLGLKLKKKKLTKNYSYYCVSLDDLLEFLKEHQELWNSQFLEKGILGKEAEWLLEKRKMDIDNHLFEYRCWTKRELELAKYLLLHNYNYDEISEQVNHSPIGVAYKIRDLGLGYRLSQFWKGSELKLIKEGYLNMPIQELSQTLGRTPKAIRAKALQLGIKKRVLKRETK